MVSGPAQIGDSRQTRPARSTARYTTGQRVVHNGAMSDDAGPGLVSVGYEGRTAEDLLSVLVEQHVDVVADVRLTPMSRKPGLSKTRLREALAAAGVDYIHLKSLGNPKENREPFWTGAVAIGVARFRELMAAPEPAASLDDLARLARTQRVAVLCFERDHARCHRQVVTEEVTARSVDTSVTYA